jgi:hypothetical protein
MIGFWIEIPKSHPNLDWTILAQTLWRQCFSPNVIETIHDLLQCKISEGIQSALRTAMNNELCITESMHGLQNSAKRK